MSYSKKWQQARAERKTRRGTDPKVQQRAFEHAVRGDREAAEQETKLRRGAA